MSVRLARILKMSVHVCATSVIPYQSACVSTEKLCEIITRPVIIRQPGEHTPASWNANMRAHVL